MIIEKILVPKLHLKNYITTKSLKTRRAFLELAKPEEESLSLIKHPEFLDPIFSSLPLGRLSAASEYRMAVKKHMGAYKKELFSPKKGGVNELFNSYMKFRKKLDSITQELKFNTKNCKPNSFIKTIQDQPTYDLQELGPKNALITKMLINMDNHGASKWISIYLKEIQQNAQANQVELPKSTLEAYNGLMKILNNKKFSILKPLRTKEIKPQIQEIQEMQHNKALIA